VHYFRGRREYGDLFVMATAIDDNAY